jgi:hypothetical protein
VSFPGNPVPFKVAADVVRTERMGAGLRLLHAGAPQRAYFSACIMKLAEATTES